MTDILIPDVPDDVIAAIDAKARRLGLSRTEYLRRTLARERGTATAAVSVADLTVFATTFADLGDLGVVDRAWR
jgi:hypothetical protein